MDPAKVFAKSRGRHNRKPGKNIGTEVSRDYSASQTRNQRTTANQKNGDERPSRPVFRNA